MFLTFRFALVVLGLVEASAFVSLVEAQGPGIATIPLTLVDGKKALQPNDTHSAIRVRVADLSQAITKPELNEIRLALGLTPEPKLILQSIESIRINKAIDDQNQMLTQPALGDNKDAIIQDSSHQEGSSSRTQFTSFRLTRGTRPSRSLQEVKGVLTVQVITPGEPLITIDDLLQSKGKEFKGKSGGLIKVTAVHQHPNGSLTVQFEMVPPPQLDPDPSQPLPLLQLMANPMFLFSGGSYDRFSMLDETGDRIRPSATGHTVHQVGPMPWLEHRLTFPNTKNKKTRLIYSVSQSVTVDVPFTLKNVPIP